MKSSMAEIPILTTERLQLRALTMDDAQLLADLLQEPAIAANGLGIPQPYQLSDAQNMIERVGEGPAKNHFTWGITLRPNNEVIGIITIIITSSQHRAEIGYWIGKPYWNQGYASEAGRALISDAFSRHELNRIYAKSFTDNPSSARVLEKIGMTYEGLLRQHLWHELSGQYKDTFVYSILKSEHIT